MAIEIILTHQNADFDAVASMLGAHKLFPNAVPVLPSRQHAGVAQFLALYRNGLPFVRWEDFSLREGVSKIILTDTQNVAELDGIAPDTPTHIFEHHPLERDLKPHEVWHGEPLGAVTTLLVEMIDKQHIPLTSLEATLLALGIYSDTGMLTFGGTTPRDLKAAAWLMEHGAVLDTVRRFLSNPLNAPQQALFEALLEAIHSRTLRGFDISICSATSNEHIGGINTIAAHLREVLDADALFVLVQFPNQIQLVARSTQDAIHVGNLAQHLGGGGHPRAAAAAIYKGTLAEVEAAIWDYLDAHITPAVRIADLMSYGAQTVQAEAAVRDIIQRLRRIGHEGYPVLEDGQVVGLLTLRDADKALEHGLHDARVRDVMLGGTITLQPDDSVSALEQTMVRSDWGQIPIVNQKHELIGIVTRTDLIKHWAQAHPTKERSAPVLERSTAERVLGTDNVTLIATIAHHAQHQNIPAYMVGGVVRDLLLERPNYDMDFVVEGDAIAFAEHLREQYGGRIHSYRPFGTAKWRIDEDAADALSLPFQAIPDHLDFATARSELYEHPTALPTVYNSGIKLDLRRRDFTINALAVQLSPAREMWRILDFYGGQADLEERLLRVLHSLSFVDDPTRILRAVRFGERLRFTIEPRTAELIQSARPMLRRITGERLRNELSLLLQEPDPVRGFLKLEALGALPAIHPDFHAFPAIQQAFQALQERPDWIADTLELRWHLILAQIDKEKIRPICDRLLFNRSQTAEMQQTAALVQQPALLTDSRTRPSEIDRLLTNQSETTLQAAWLLLDDATARRHIVQFREEWRSRKPLLDGNTLRDMGLPAGPHYRLILERLRQAVLDEDIHSREDEQERLEQIIADIYEKDDPDEDHD